MNRPSLLAILLLAACALDPPGPAPEELGRPSVELVRVGHVVEFADGVRDMGPVERVRLDAFLRDVRLDRRDHVAVLSGHGPAAAERAAAVASFLDRLGIAAEPLRLPFTSPVPAGTVAVVVERAAVDVPSCGDFPGETAADRYANRPIPNFGCATTRNLALMVTDPRDLVAGRPVGDADGSVMAAGVRRYLQGRTKPLLGESSFSATSGPPRSGD